MFIFLGYQLYPLSWLTITKSAHWYSVTVTYFTSTRCSIKRGGQLLWCPLRVRRSDSDAGQCAASSAQPGLNGVTPQCLSRCLSTLFDRQLVNCTTNSTWQTDRQSTTVLATTTHRHCRHSRMFHSLSVIRRPTDIGGRWSLTALLLQTNTLASALEFLSAWLKPAAPMAQRATDN